MAPLESANDELTKEDRLILSVALSMCFTFKVDPGGVAPSDVEQYVDHLVALYKRNPSAATHARAPLPSDMRSAVEFCAEHLEPGAPALAARLRRALLTA